MKLSSLKKLLTGPKNMSGISAGGVFRPLTAQEKAYSRFYTVRGRQYLDAAYGSLTHTYIGDVISQSTLSAIADEIARTIPDDQVVEVRSE